MKKYEILGGNLPVVVCELSAGESMITESGSMSWMSPNMKMETISGGGMKKMFGRLMSGDSAFQNRYTAEGADGMIAFASSFPGAIKALEISKSNIIDCSCDNGRRWRISCFGISGNSIWMCFFAWNGCGSRLFVYYIWNE